MWAGPSLFLARRPTRSIVVHCSFCRQLKTFLFPSQALCISSTIARTAVESRPLHGGLLWNAAALVGYALTTMTISSDHTRHTGSWKCLHVSSDLPCVRFAYSQSDQHGSARRLYGIDDIALNRLQTTTTSCTRQLYNSAHWYESNLVRHS